MIPKASVYQYPKADLAGLPLVEGVTIDDITTLDMDDGLMVERHGNQWRLLISIADASRLVPPGSPMDLAARRQGFSLYDDYKPMLSGGLDRDHLSLVEGALRPAVTIDIWFDDQFNVTASSIYRSAFFNRKKLSYERFLELSGDANRRFFLRDGLSVNFHAWSQLADGLAAKRRQSGAFTFDDLERELELSEGRLPRNYVSKRHGGHAIVEESAILGNSIIADFTDAHGIPALYRNHAADAVDPELGPRVIHNIREAIADKNKTDFRAAVRRLRLWLLRARYGTEVEGHFGLALKRYTHFTSPIRRYADLALHRNLVAYLEGKPFVHSKEELSEIAAHLNARNDEERNFHQSEMYKEMLYRRMQRRVRAKGALFNDLHDEELRMALFVAHHEKIENRHLANHIGHLADLDNIGPLVKGYLVNDVQSRSKYWRALREYACDSQDDPRLMRTFARSALDWAPGAEKLAVLAAPRPVQMAIAPA